MSDLIEKARKKGAWTPERTKRFKATMARKKAAKLKTLVKWKKADKRAAKPHKRGVYPKSFARESETVVNRSADRHKNRGSTSKIDLALKLAEAITLLLK